MFGSKAVLAHIRQDGYTYTLSPGSYGDLNPTGAIDEFWLDRKLGFCEHFAASFVVIMRAMDVPARASLLEKREYFRARRATIPWTTAQLDLEALEVDPRADSLRTVEAFGVGVEDGGVIEQGLAWEREEYEQVFGLMSDDTAVFATALDSAGIRFYGARHEQTEDVNDLGESFEVVSEATDLVAVRTALQAAGIDYDSAEAEFVPDMQVQLDKDNAAKVFRLIEALEDSDDVQNVFANFDVSDEVMAELDA